MPVRSTPRLAPIGCATDGESVWPDPAVAPSRRPTGGARPVAIGAASCRGVRGVAADARGAADGATCNGAAAVSGMALRARDQGAYLPRLAVLARDCTADVIGRDRSSIRERQEGGVQNGVTDLAAHECAAERHLLEQLVGDRMLGGQMQPPDRPALVRLRGAEVDNDVHPALEGAIDPLARIR